MNRRPVAERRAQLAEAAISIATRDGLSATTTRAVAAEAGVSLGSVHYCFTGKDELLLEMSRVLVAESVAAASAAISAGTDRADAPTGGRRPGARQGRDVEAVVRRALAAYWTTVRARPERHLLTYELAAWGVRAGNAVAQEQRRAQLSRTSEIVSLLTRQSGIRWQATVSELAFLVVAITDGVTLAWLVDRDDEAASAALDAFAAQLAAYAAPG